MGLPDTWHAAKPVSWINARNSAGVYAAFKVINPGRFSRGSLLSHRNHRTSVNMSRRKSEMSTRQISSKVLRGSAYSWSEPFVKTASNMLASNGS